MADHTIQTLEQFRELMGESHAVNYDKAMTSIDEHIRHFLSLSTFLTIASIDAEGRMDVSPKGDPPGFVRVVDDHTVAIPERKGNRRADTFTNVLQNPSVALICFVPGMDETMRINGKASLTVDPALLATMEVNGNVPQLAMLVDVEEAFIHCGKAPKRGRLWDADAQIERATFPKMGEVMFDHGELQKLGITREQMAQSAQDDYENRVY
ncbi:MAG: pyridoxamine 5'-phosphate oxidase family protein [Chloroflexi bacterium]|nr:pyridoxamine 5'-phosphate oxidase family protein [Chloroflexota bacterium]MDA1145347.1 pyridoxamine 5'-phosphate oxidase family protein [Chloroflexota bacterium]